MKKNSGVLGLKQSISNTVSSGIFDSFDQFNAKKQNLWMWTPKITAAANSSLPATLYANTLYNIGVSGEAYTSNQTLYWTINYLNANTTSSDFSTTSGTFTYTANTQSGVVGITIGSVGDPSQATKSFSISIRSGNTSGPVILTSNAFNVSITAAPPYIPVPNTTNLWAHWDFSLLASTAAAGLPSPSSGSNTTWSGLAANTIILTGSLSGVGSYTSNLMYRTSSAASYPLRVGRTAGGLSYIRFPVSGGSGVGCWLESVTDVNGAFPNITSSGYSWFEVVRWVDTPTGWSRPLRWKLTGYNYDYNHATYWGNGSTGVELNWLNYAAAQIALNYTDAGANRSSLSLQVNVITITDRAFSIYRCVGSNTVSSSSLSLTSGTITYSTTTASNRILQIHDVEYTGSTYYEGMDIMELGFYSAPLSTAAANSLAVALYNKWSA